MDGAAASGGRTTDPHSCARRSKSAICASKLRSSREKCEIEPVLLSGSLHTNRVKVNAADCVDAVQG